MKREENSSQIVLPESTSIVPLTQTEHILELAVRQAASVEVLAKLLELRQQEKERQAREAFEVAFAAFKAEAPKLEKTKTVTFGTTSYKYTPLDVVANAVGPVLAKHGLSYNWTQANTKDEISVTCVLRHTQGHSLSNTLVAGPDTSGSKNSIQGIGSAVYYLRRYTLLGVLGMASSEEDTDGVTNAAFADFLANIQTSMNAEELEKRSKEGIAAAYRAKNSSAAKILLDARAKREKELRAA